MMRETASRAAAAAAAAAAAGRSTAPSRSTSCRRPGATRRGGAASQLENLDAILDTVKRTYNVDENRVVLSGVSDGATGLYYVAMRDTTPFASFLPLNGFMMVLANDRARASTPSCFRPTC